MEKRRPIQAGISSGGEATDAEVSAERFKEALARWASTVTVFAVRDPDDGSVHATTVTSFAPVALHPPLVVVSLSPSAQALPFVEVGRTAAISLLAEDQARWASMFAESYPVGPKPWPEDGVPLIPDAVAALVCAVEAIHPTAGGSRLVLCRVDEIVLGGAHRPLVYWQRAYRGLEE